jgi:hypothetical protein
MSSADLYNKGLTSCKRERSGPIKIILKKPIRGLVEHKGSCFREAFKRRIASRIWPRTAITISNVNEAHGRYNLPFEILFCFLKMALSFCAELRIVQTIRIFFGVF